MFKQSVDSLLFFEFLYDVDVDDDEANEDDRDTRRTLCFKSLVEWLLNSDESFGSA
jgi:hypothetical protein